MNMILSLSLVLLASSPLLAEYYLIPVTEDVTELAQQKRLPKQFPDSKNQLKAVLDTLRNRGEQVTSVRLPLQHEGYLLTSSFDSEGRRKYGSSVTPRLLLKCKKGQLVKGYIDMDFYPNTLSFRVDTGLRKSISHKEFNTLKTQYYSGMTSYCWHTEKPLGQAYFSYLAKAKVENDAPNIDLEGSMAIFTGAHAIAENLSLDRDLILAEGSSKKTEKISSIKGVTVKPIDWSSMLKGVAEVEIDSLAALVPEDQHGVFAPSLHSLLEIIKVSETEGVAAQTFSCRNPFRGLVRKYKQQMGLDLPDGMARLIDVGSVAITGGDPFFPTGTDVAVIFQKKHASVSLAIAAAAQSQNVKMSSGSIDGFEYFAFVNQDRSFSSFTMSIGQHFVVSNSKYQLEKLVDAHRKKISTLSQAEEFKFFRNRYPIGKKEADQASVFVYISDACLRRWCGPAIRIGASRRNRATAAMLGVTAQALVENREKYSSFKPHNDFLPLLGKIGWQGELACLQSERYNTLNFMTPISELGIDEVSKTEADAYRQWRRGYEEGWSTVFDPIAFDLRVTQGEIEMDLSVMPIRSDSDYGKLVNIVGDSTLSFKSTNLTDKDSILLSLAIDKDGQMMKSLEKGVSKAIPTLKVKPLSWLGESISLKVMLTKDMKRLAAFANTEQVLFNMPAVVRLETTDPLKRALFLSGVKTLIDTAAPGEVSYKTRKYKGVSYVVMKPSDKGDGGLPDFQMNYATLPGVVVFSFNENALQESIEEELKSSKQKPLVVKSPTQLFAAIVPSDFLSILNLVQDEDDSLAAKRRKQSHRAIAILNEMKRICPEWNAPKVYNKLFGSYLACPGNSPYVWDSQAFTHKSESFGHIGEPLNRDGEFHRQIKSYRKVEFGLNFEHGGIRVKGVLSKANGK